MKDINKIKICEHCKKYYKKDPDSSYKFWFARKYCSNECSIKGKTGKYHYNLGRKINEETRKKMSETHSGEKHPSYINGYSISYNSLHRWVRKQLGKALVCQLCGSLRFVDWANISWEYKRDIRDWMSLCRKCHHKYDLNGKLGVTRKKFPEYFRRSIYV